MAEEVEVAKVDSDIHKLSAFGILDVLQKLVEQDGVDVNTKDDQGCAPLIWAIRNGHKDVTKYLIDQVARV